MPRALSARRESRCWGHRPDRLQQCVGSWRQANTSVYDFHPGSKAVKCPSRRLLVGETGEPSQMTPVCAGQIATIRTRQLLARRCRHSWFQRTGAEANPSLQMAGAGLQNHTRIMPIGTHALHHRRFGSIEVDENKACVPISGVGLNIDVASFAIASTQKSDGVCIYQLRRRPKPFSRKCSPCFVVNQTDQVQLVRHRRQLPANGVPGKKKSAVVHDRHFAIGTRCRTMDSQWTANSVLTGCLTPGDKFNYTREISAGEPPHCRSNTLGAAASRCGCELMPARQASPSFS